MRIRKLTYTRVFFIVLTGLMLMHGKLEAQPTDAAFRNITSADGLPNTSIADISQDALGFIWIATWDGVYRFDGKEYFRISRKDCRRLAADDHGGVWMSFTGNGSVGYYNIYSDSIKQYKLQEGTWSPPIKIDDKGNVWAAVDQGIIRLDAAADTFLVDYPLVSNVNGYLSASGNGELLFITRDQDTRQFLIGSRNSMGEYTFEELPIDENNPEKGKRFNEAYPPFGLIPYGANGFLIINKFGWAIKDDPKEDWIFRKPSNMDLIDNFESELLDSEGNLWLNQASSLCRIDIHSGESITYGHDPEDLNSILTLSNLGAGGNLFLDRQGILWITRYGQGISRLNLFESDLGLVKDEHGKPLLDVLSALELEDGSFFIGARTIDNGLYYFDKDGHVLERYGTPSPDAPPGRSVSSQLSHPFVWSLSTTSDGSIWAGTGWPREGQGGLNRLYPGSKQITHFKMDPEDENSLSDDWIISTLIDGSGRLWMSTRRNGWCWIDPRTEKITRGFSDREFDSLEIDNWSYGFIDNDGNLVFENNNQYFELDHNTFKLTPFAPDVKSSETLYYILQDESSRVWFISSKGFGFLNEKQDDIAYYYDLSEKGFPADEVSTIQVDDHGKAWLATSNGIVRFNPENKEITHFGYSRGLQGNYFRGSLSYKGPSGKIYFAGNAGINIIDPDKININPYPPDMVFTGLRLDGSPVEPGAGSAIKMSISIAEEVVIGPEISVISIDFAAIHFAGDHENQYQFQLEGFDKDWRDGGSYGNATYTSLPNGTYTFRIRGSNWDGVWSDGSKSLKIIILPPWWKTWWAYSLYIILLATGIFLFDRYRKRWLLEKERAAAKEKELAQAREIEKAYEELKATQKQLIHSEKMASLGELTAGIAHEIQNPLNFVNNFSEVSVELLEEMDEDLQNGKLEGARSLGGELRQNLEKISHHGHRASSIVRGMLEHSRTSNGQKEPVDIKTLADEYLRLAYHGLRAKDKSFQANFKLEADEDVPMIRVIPQDMGRVLLNLINNAFYAVSMKMKATADPGFKPEVAVIIKKGNKAVEIRVRDNGDGIPDEVREKIFQPFFTTKPTGEGTGLGLSLSYDIVIKGHGGELTVESQQNAGTEFIIVIPE